MDKKQEQAGYSRHTLSIEDELFKKMQLAVGIHARYRNLSEFINAAIRNQLQKTNSAVNDSPLVDRQNQLVSLLKQSLSHENQMQNLIREQNKLILGLQEQFTKVFFGDEPFSDYLLDNKQKGSDHQ